MISSWNAKSYHGTAIAYAWCRYDIATGGHGIAVGYHGIAMAAHSNNIAGYAIAMVLR